MKYNLLILASEETSILIKGQSWVDEETPQPLINSFKKDFYKLYVWSND